MQKWREALAEVANMSGRNSTNLHEASLIESIVCDVHTKLGLRFSEIPSILVGIEERVREVEEVLDISSDGRRSVGIVGMGGLGKTTLAWVVYERMLHLFNSGSFLANVREVSEKEGIAFLQKQLLSQAGGSEKIANFYNAFDGVRFIRSRMQHLKVLIVLDDVDDICQVEHLVGDLHWFGPGSRIILTTRNKRLLDKVDHTYEVKPLDDNEALTLFRNNAFGGNESADQPYESYSLAICHYCDGLPLALKLIGSALAGQIESEWFGMIRKLAEEPTREIIDILRRSYDGLDDTARNAFLYTATSLQGYLELTVENVLSCLGLFPEINLRILKDKSLISISNNCVRVHNLLYELCRNILARDSSIDPEKRLMILSTCFTDNILDDNTGSEATEGLFVGHQEGQEHPTRCSLRAISGLTKLRFLFIKDHDIKYVGVLKFLSNELRYLEWKYYPWTSLPQSFEPHDIRKVNLLLSSIRTLWDYDKFFGQLKWLNLSDSTNLLMIPDLSNLPNLQLLCLEGCTNLFEIRSSRALHENLILIILSGCTRLGHLPKAIDFRGLTEFRLSGCSSLEIFPEICGRMEKFTHLNLDETAITKLPSSINQLVALKELTARNCRELQNLRSTFVDLESLETLDLSGCSSLNNLPENFERLKKLTQLNLTGSGIDKIDNLMTQLRSVLSLKLYDDRSIGSSSGSKDC